MSRPSSLVWFYYGDHREHPFVCLGAESLSRAGWAVVVADLAAPTVGTPYRHLGAAVAEVPRGGGVLRRLRAAWRAVRAQVRLFRITVPVKPRVVVVTRPHVIPVAWLVARVVGARLVYYPFELLGDQRGFTDPLLMTAERLLLRWGVDALITQNEQRAHVYRKERASRVTPIIVHNYKPRHVVSGPGRLRELVGAGPGERVVLYQGLLIPGRWLERLVQAAAYFPAGVSLVLMGQTSDWWRDTVEPLLCRPELRQRVRVAPFVPHGDVPAYVRDADLGVIIYDDSTRNNRFCEPGKLSDYVQAGLPVVAPDFPTIGPVIRRYGIGTLFTGGDPREIAAAVAAGLAIPKEILHPGLQRARDELSWEREFPAFLSAIDGTARVPAGDAAFAGNGTGGTMSSEPHNWPRP